MAAEGGLSVGLRWRLARRSWSSSSTSRPPCTRRVPTPASGQSSPGRVAGGRRADRSSAGTASRPPRRDPESTPRASSGLRSDRGATSRCAGSPPCRWPPRRGSPRQRQGRRELDRVALTVALDDQRGVIEVASLAMLECGLHGLEDPAIEANRMTARAQRNPVQLRGRGRRCLHRGSKARRPSDRWHPELPRTAAAVCPQAWALLRDLTCAAAGQSAERSR
jgi:hypothetical protein